MKSIHKKIDRIRWKINKNTHSAIYQVWGKLLILSYPIEIIIRRHSRQILFEVKNEINNR
jgi:hypothetical protein